MALRLSGALTSATVPGQLKALELPADGAVDLSAVGQVDSSALALLLELTRQSNAKGVKLQCVGAPQPLLDLARFFEIDQTLALNSST